MHGNTKEARKEKLKLADQGLKRCGTCRVTYPIKKFGAIAPSVRWRGDGLKNSCRYCENNFVRKNKKDKKNILKRMKVELGCSICGYRESASLLHWHHRKPSEKSFNIAHSFHETTLDKILEEVKKCDVVCQDCHFEVHRVRS